MSSLGVSERFACRATAAAAKAWHVGSFNVWLRDELLDGEVLHTVTEARVLIERWRRHFNEKRPHSSLGHRPPAPGVMPFAPPSRAAAMDTSVRSSH
jgi:transposase InsO family protein